MKKHRILRKTLLIVSLVLVSVIATAGFVAVFTLSDMLAAAGSVEKLEENLYYMEFRGDYGFDRFLENGGAESESEMADYIISFLSGGYVRIDREDVPLEFGCSALTSTSDEAQVIMGRNYDWDGKNRPVMIIHTVPDEGYESYSTTWLDFLGFGEDYLPEGFSNQYMSLAGIYVPLDGINEKGLCVADLLAGDKAQTNQNTGKTDLTTTSAIRLLLDNAANVEEAVKLLSNYDMHSSINTSHHLAISDAEGNSVVVEYVDNEMTVTDTKAVTNHYLSEGEKFGIGNAESHKRFDKLITLEETIGNEDDMRDTLSQVSYENETQWSIVYNLSNRSLDFYFNRNYASSYSYKVD